MRITVVGAGAVGGTLAKEWAAKGHQVTVEVRDLESDLARAVVERHEATVKEIGDSLGDAEAAVFAIPGTAMSDVIRRVAGHLRAKLVIDATNNISAPVRNSIAVISAFAPSARVYRAFNSLPAQTLAEPTIGGKASDMFYCGPEGAGRELVESLIEATGLNPIYVGGVEWAPVVDALGGLSFALGRTRPGARLALNLVTA